MLRRTHLAGAAAGFMLSLWLNACGGGGGSKLAAPTPPPATSNVATATVDSGPSGNSVNTLFVSVKLCVPGSTTECQTVDHIQVDTGSYGLRVLSSALTPTLSLPLEAVNGGSLVECVGFVDGYSWGPVVQADITIAGESAYSLPIQAIGDSRFPTVPSDCSALGTAENTVAAFGANGILGIGPFAYDCGDACATAVIPASYYVCTGGTCNGVVAALAKQVQSAIMHFTTDNNGAILELPSVAADGAAGVTGSLIFGIDTQSNNASGTETVLTVSTTGSTVGDLTALFNGQTLTTSFLDSGTNGTYFNDSALSTCTQTGLTGFYCPSNPLGFSVMLTGNNGNSATVAFTVADANSLLNTNPTFTALPELAGTFPSSTTSFDFGLPFFYGRRVAVALEGSTTSAGTGPYFAF